MARLSPDVDNCSEQSSLLRQGHWLASIGDIKSSFQAYSKAFRIGPVEKETMSHLVSALMKATQDQRNADSGSTVRSARPDNRQPFYCPVCLGLLLEPVTLSCGHTLCKSCVEDRQPPSSGDCCRDSLTSDCTFKMNVLLASLIRKSAPSTLVKMEELKLEGKKCLLEGQAEKARRCFSAVLESFPCDVTALCGSCDANTELGLYELALQDAEMACKLRPEMAKALQKKADALMKLHNNEEAVFTYLQCTAIVPHNEECHEKLLGALAQLFSPPECTKEAISPLKSSILRRSDRETLLTNVKRGYLPATEGVINRDDLECKLCYNVLFQPVTAPCGHSFCQDCLRRSLDHRPECPCCRTGLAPYLARRKMNVTQVLEGLVKEHFQSEYLEREERYLKELERLKRVGHDDDVEIPIFCCTVAFPTVQCPLHIFEPRYRLMIRRCVESGSRRFGMCLSSTDPQKPHFVDYGTVLQIGDVRYLPDGRSIIQTVGGRRFHVISRGMVDGYHTAKVEWLSDSIEAEPEDLAQLNVTCYDLLRTWFQRLTVEQQNCVASALGPFPACESVTHSPDGPSWVWWALASLPLQDNFKVIILAMTSLRERLNSIQRFVYLLIKSLDRR